MANGAAAGHRDAPKPSHPSKRQAKAPALLRSNRRLLQPPKRRLQPRPTANARSVAPGRAAAAVRARRARAASAALSGPIVRKSATGLNEPSAKAGRRAGIGIASATAAMIIGHRGAGVPTSGRAARNPIRTHLSPSYWP